MIKSAPPPEPRFAKIAFDNVCVEVMDEALLAHEQHEGSTSKANLEKAKSKLHDAYETVCRSYQAKNKDVPEDVVKTYEMQNHLMNLTIKKMEEPNV